MNDKNYKIIFKVNGLKGSIYESIKDIEPVMESELLRVYNLYADKTNNGITENLNNEFKVLYPNYFEENKGKEWYDLVEYNKFISNGYQHLIVDDFNNKNISPILNFYVDPNEVVFTGYLKYDRNITISFCLKEI